MINFIKNLIKYCITGNQAKDDGVYSLQQINNGNIKDACVLYPYGMHANAPSGSFGISFNIQGKEENPACIITSTLQRKKGLKSGEVEFGNLAIGSTTFYDNAGNIVATAQANYTINASDLTINCNTTINGNITSTGNITTTGNITGSVLTGASVMAGGVNVGSVLSGGAGVSGTFTNDAGDTLTITDGIITGIS